jgi:D-amino peptidase
MKKKEGSDKMKVFISVDIEGISGIVDGSEGGRDKGEYEKARDLMVADVNAAIDGILALGDSEIVVSDAHGGMKNINPNKLNEAAILIRGTPKPLTQMAGIDDSFDAVMFIGYHSKKGTLQGILSHTISGRVIESISINGMEVGETAINAAIAGYYGVPLVFVSGDLAVTKETKEINPEIVVAAVKEAVSRTAAKCLHPVRARKLITKNANMALKKRDSIEPFKFKAPFEVIVKYANARMADAVEFMPSAKRINGRTIKIVQHDYLKAFGALRASIYIAGAVA